MSLKPKQLVLEEIISSQALGLKKNDASKCGDCTASVMSSFELVNVYVYRVCMWVYASIVYMHV